MRPIHRGLVWVARGNAAVLAVVILGWSARFVGEASDAGMARGWTASVVLTWTGPVLAVCCIDLLAARAVRRRGLAAPTRALLAAVLALAVIQVLVGAGSVGEATSLPGIVVLLAVSIAGAVLAGWATAVVVDSFVRGTRASADAMHAHAFTAAEVARSRAYQGRVQMASRLALLCSLGSLPILIAAAHRARTTIDDLPWLIGLVLTVTAVHLVVSAPMVALGAYRSLRLDREFGLTTRSTGAWWWDARRELVVNGATAAVGGMLLWTSVSLGGPQWATAWATLSFVAVSTHGLRPIVVGWLMPLRPADASLQAMADELADATGAPRTPVLVAPMRERRAAPNAFVAGLGPFRRIVVFDVLLDLEPEQLKAVIAHEVGHVARGHLLRRLPIVVLANGAVVVALALLGAFNQGRWSAAEYPVVALVTTVATIYASPVIAAISRRQEREADAFALDATRAPSTFAAMIRAISVSNLAPLTASGVATLGCTHPPAAIRMDSASRWATDHATPSTASATT